MIMVMVADYFASAFTTAALSQLTALSSPEYSCIRPSSASSVSGHDSTMWFVVHAWQRVHVVSQMLILDNATGRLSCLKMVQYEPQLERKVTRWWLDSWVW